MQPKDRLRLSRRKVLAGLGTVGLASAGAGLGTTAYFSDREDFENNRLTAGELDLKLDYKATYLGGEGRLAAVKAMGYPDAEYLGDGRYLLDQAPSPADMQKWEDLVQGDFDFCSPEADQYLVNGDELPMFTLSDVKPGDSGEVTVSLHICDNPAWMRMVGEITENAENGRNEPEMDADSTDGQGELADSIEVCVWYDEDCDNKFEQTGTGEGRELEVALVSDVSGSMSGSIGDLQTAAKGFVDNLSNPDEAAAISFSSGASLDQELTTDYDAVKNAIDTYSSGGTTNMTDGISEGEDELINGTNATAGASKVMILLSDGEPDDESAAEAAADAAKDAGIRIFTIALGSADTTFLEGIATSPSDAYVAPTSDDLDGIYAQIAQVVLAGEQAIACGTMREVFDKLAADGGVLLDGDRSEEGVPPYPGATTQCVGFEWSLPADVGNEVQSDGIAFSFGFMAEQSRHNPILNATPGDGWPSFVSNDHWSVEAKAGELGNDDDVMGDKYGFGRVDKTWTAKTDYPFALSYDGASNATFDIAGETISSTAIPSAASKLGVVAKGYLPNHTVSVSDLALDDGAFVPNAVSAAPGDGKKNLVVDGATLSDGFTLTGTLRFDGPPGSVPEGTGGGMQILVEE